MKKWFTFILLLITLTGTFYPCCLTDGCNEDEIATAQKENKRQPKGACSPFFACAACTGFTEIANPIQMYQPVTENLVHSKTVLSFNLTTYASSFWQPPRSC